MSSQRFSTKLLTYTNFTLPDYQINTLQYLKQPRSHLRDTTAEPSSEAPKDSTKPSATRRHGVQPKRHAGQSCRRSQVHICIRKERVTSGVTLAFGSQPCSVPVRKRVTLLILSVIPCKGASVQHDGPCLIPSVHKSHYFLTSNVTGAKIELLAKRQRGGGSGFKPSCSICQQRHCY